VTKSPRFCSRRSLPYNDVITFSDMDHCICLQTNEVDALCLGSAKTVRRSLHRKCAACGMCCVVVGTKEHRKNIIVCQ